MSQKINIAVQNTQIGLIGIAECSGSIINVYLPNQTTFIKNQNVTENSLLRQAFKQIQEYLSGTRYDFDIPILITKTDFAFKTLTEITKIPYGITKSYNEIAISIGNSAASRAVGMVCSKNPLPIFIPCHRVIGSKGELTGYAGGIKLKQYLLELESHN